MDSIDSLSKAINYLGLNLLKEVTKEVGNVFFSPFSVAGALAAAFVGSSGETAKEMASVLGFEKAELKGENVKNLFLHLFSDINNASNLYTLNTANVVLKDKKFLIQEGFQNVLENFFNALLVESDFVDGSAEVVETINDWVKSKTNGMVTNLLDSLDSDTKMVILNATYFKGFWLHAFEEKSTFLQYFYSYGDEDEAKLVEMMHLKETFFMAEDSSYKALELPYKGGNLSMLILLPNLRNGVEDLEKEISAEFLKNVQANMHITEVEVALPKINFEYSKSFKDPLKNLGLKQAFSDLANFDKISKTENICVSDVIHKAVLNITEEGTEAAATTLAKMKNLCLTNCAEFIIDRPFLFLIKDSKTNIILFLGKIVELQQFENSTCCKNLKTGK